MPPADDRRRAVAALRFRALGDETRLRVLETLTTGERCVGDIMDALGLGQSSKHGPRARFRGGRQRRVADQMFDVFE